MPHIGIDFGTTNSLMVAYNKETNEFMYFNYLGEQPVPTSSTVWYHDNETVVGEKARANFNRYSDIEGHHFERSIKLKLGKGESVDIFGKKEKPSRVASDILRAIRKEATETYQANKVADILQAVFTIPINFNGLARKALREAARNAGFEVKTFLHEPFASIIGHYFVNSQHHNLNDIIQEINQLNGQYLLTFDWGGGTLDITVVNVANGKMLELGTAELSGVAGDKFDELIARYIWDRFCSKNGNKYKKEYLEKIRKEKWDRLIATAEQCKIRLSKDSQADFLIETIISEDNIGIDETLTRTDFEGIISDSLDSACNKIDDAIREAGINKLDISCVLLTGGSCYIPVVQDRLKEKFGHRVETVKDAELLIAQGAAVISEMGWLPFLTKDIQIELSDNSYWAMFEKGMPIASGKQAKIEERFTCVDSRQGYAKIIVCEGRGQKKDSNLAIINIPVLNDFRFGDDITVTGEIDSDIILRVTARSLMVHGYGQAKYGKPDEEYSERKTAEVHKMCFGLDFGGI